MGPLRVAVGLAIGDGASESPGRGSAAVSVTVTARCQRASDSGGPGADSGEPTRRIFSRPQCIWHCARVRAAVQNRAREHTSESGDEGLVGPGRGYSDTGKALCPD